MEKTDKWGVERNKTEKRKKIRIETEWNSRENIIYFPDYWLFTFFMHNFYTLNLFM